MANNDKVILSEEPNHPNQVRLNIQDPTKPKPNAGKMIKKQQKVPFLDRVISAFCGGNVDRSNLGEYILKERLEPIGLRMLNNGIQSTLKRTGDAAQVMLFGRVVNSSNGPTDYTSFSNPNVIQPGGYRVMDQVEVFAFRNKNDADACLAYLKGRLQTYRSVGVLDYFEWINEYLHMDIPIDYSMADRGWYDLNNVTVLPDPNGFVINFPRPVFLKRGG